MITASRRGFLGGLACSLAAPAIVRAGSLMPVRSLPALNPWWQTRMSASEELIAITRKALVPQLYKRPPLLQAAMDAGQISLVSDPFCPPGSLYLMRAKDYVCYDHDD